ncbi:MAG: hypothetical protein JO309_15845 [Pseudonocardiales bacterium]|nr:hypothetical protein [Pseudonocardiales bacterium]MBV9730844.1 hypothetical protein [Pseudonocardiales bacterium]
MALPDPAGLPGLGTGSDLQKQELKAVYFDTADPRLLPAGSHPAASDGWLCEQTRAVS